MFHLLCFSQLLKQIISRNFPLKRKIIYSKIENFLLWIMHFPGDTSSFKVSNGKTTAMCEICSKLTAKTPEQCWWQLGLNLQNIYERHWFFSLCYIMHCSVFIHLNDLNPLVIQLLAQILLSTTQLKVSFLIHTSFKFAHELRWRE